jgi:hypothetical protein
MILYYWQRKNPKWITAKCAKYAKGGSPLFAFFAWFAVNDLDFEPFCGKSMEVPFHEAFTRQTGVFPVKVWPNPVKPSQTQSNHFFYFDCEKPSGRKRSGVHVPLFLSLLGEPARPGRDCPQLGIGRGSDVASPSCGGQGLPALPSRGPLSGWSVFAFIAGPVPLRCSYGRGRDKQWAPTMTKN